MSEQEAYRRAAAEWHRALHADDRPLVEDRLAPSQWEPVLVLQHRIVRPPPCMRARMHLVLIRHPGREMTCTGVPATMSGSAGGPPGLGPDHALLHIMLCGNVRFEGLRGAVPPPCGQQTFAGELMVCLRTGAGADPASASHQRMEALMEGHVRAHGPGCCCTVSHLGGSQPIDGQPAMLPGTLGPRPKACMHA